MDDQHRVHLERQYWQACSTDPDVDEKYIADVDTKACVDLVVECLGPILRGDKVLDLGCGVGRITIPLKERYPETDLTGLDISPGMLSHAVYRAARVPPHFILGDGRSIPLRDSSFDSCYSMLLFQHLEPDAVEGYIEEVGRVLKPGSVFLFQYIQGDEHEPFSHHYDPVQIKNWLWQADMKIDYTNEGLIHEQWTWVTAVRLSGTKVRG